MSRTFREREPMKYEPILMEGESLLRRLHKRYGDHVAGRLNAPKWFRKLLNRKQDAEYKAELNKLKKNEDYEVQLHPRKRNANWEYF